MVSWVRFAGFFSIDWNMEKYIGNNCLLSIEIILLVIKTILAVHFKCGKSAIGIVFIITGSIVNVNTHHKWRN